MSSDLMQLAKRLKALRAERGLTQAALAARAGLALAYVGRLEIGQHDPSLSTLRALARALRVPVGQLAGDPPRRAQMKCDACNRPMVKRVLLGRRNEAGGPIVHHECENGHSVHLAYDGSRGFLRCDCPAN